MTESLSVTISRTFRAPIDAVYRAWTDPRQVIRWMKCEPDVELELEGWEPRVGATFASVMRKPGQWEVAGTGRILEVDAPRVFAYAQDANPDMHMPAMEIRVVFEEVDGGTRLTLTHRGLPSDEMCGIVQGGWTGSLHQLEQLLGGDRG